MQKILNIISLTINSIILLILLVIVISNIIDINSAGAIGVIGGSDGPTAIFFSSPYPFVIPFVFIALVLIVYEIVFFVNLNNKTSKEKTSSES